MKRRVIRKIVRVVSKFGETDLNHVNVELECGHVKLVTDHAAFGASQRVVCDQCSFNKRLQEETIKTTQKG
jgi:hypothetical protein